MRVLFAFLLLVSCRDAEPSPTVENGSQSHSPCASHVFEGDRFIVCAAAGHDIEIRTSNSEGEPYRSFSALEAALGDRASEIAFAMNAGMFGEDGNAIGLLIEDGKELHPINRRDGGGNFHMMPNGIFLVRQDGTAEVTTTAAYEGSDEIDFASQSGPMLVIDSELHPRFERDGRSRNIRNGVGIRADGSAVFAISTDLVSFGKFARFFRDVLKTPNALYFDGSVSSLWDPGIHRRDSLAAIGPMVVVFRSTESAPDREGRARP